MTNREIKGEPRDYAKLNNPKFIEIWEEWLADRKERRKPVTKRAAEMQLQFLVTQPDPVACVKQSIAKGYQGIFALAVKQPDRQQPRYGDSTREFYTGDRGVGGMKKIAEVKIDCHYCHIPFKASELEKHQEECRKS